MGAATTSSMSPNAHQGHFAEGLVASIATAAGLDVVFPRLGDKVDVGVFKPGPNGTSGSRQITLQVKSWSKGKIGADGHFHYPLSVKAFNYLAGDKHDVRHYLILCIVPDDPAIYADATHNRLKLSHAAYWLSLRDEMPDPTLDRNSTRTVLIPERNLLTPTTLHALIDGNERGAIVI